MWREVGTFLLKKSRKLLFQAIKSENNPYFKNKLIENIYHDSNIERKILKIEKNEIIAESVARLEPIYRIPIPLFYYEGLGVEEISELLNINLQTVKVRLFRARERLSRMPKIRGLKK